MDKRLEQLLPNVTKPARYTGGEWNSLVKEWGACDVRWALAFPDIYDLGMSNHGLSILYDRLNHAPGVLAERVFAPWIDMEEAMRGARLPLFSLESRRPLAQFDVIGFSLPSEQLFTNLLNMLDLAGLPVLARDRGDGHPLVIAGGGAVFNPEPLADFVDAFAIGEGEEVIFEITAAVREAKRENLPRAELLRCLARIPGIYVPRFYEVRYYDDGTLAEVRPTVAEAAMPVRKRIVTTLPPPVTRPVVPYLETVHNRAAIEIQRGCGRGCRFCHAGMTYRPVRERPLDEILAAIDELIAATGYEEIALLSLSSSDYYDIEGLVGALVERYGDRQLSISLPSLRIDSVSVDLMDRLQATGRRSSFTFAPEAATERLRGVINKPIRDEDLLSVAEEVYRRGWKTIKLYFMIGHPTQTIEDVAAIVDLAMAVRDVGRRALGRKAQVNVGVSTLVPKPHTPFQWVPLASEDEVRVQQDYLKEHLRGPGLKLNWTDYQLTLLEAVLSRGDRRLGSVIHRAWQLGARFDAWGDQFKGEAWRQAFREAEVDVGFYAWRERSVDEVLPWDHIDSGVSKRFLARDYQASLRGETHPDCREQCYGCGILTAFGDECAGLPVDAWVCPPVGAS
ncbi:MAG: TIGR03960 family B12-binding radical SAM protein [Anaerolineae bacterium]|nr:TIGR03960 family B12-binding radical SAM protein [Anaerolineae bacterium]